MGVKRTWTRAELEQNRKLREEELKVKKDTDTAVVEFCNRMVKRAVSEVRKVQQRQILPDIGRRKA